MAFTTYSQETEWALFLQPRSPHTVVRLQQKSVYKPLLDIHSRMKKIPTATHPSPRDHLFLPHGEATTWQWNVSQLLINYLLHEVLTRSFFILEAPPATRNRPWTCSTDRHIAPASHTAAEHLITLYQHQTSSDTAAEHLTRVMMIAAWSHYVLLYCNVDLKCHKMTKLSINYCVLTHKMFHCSTFSIYDGQSLNSSASSINVRCTDNSDWVCVNNWLFNKTNTSPTLTLVHSPWVYVNLNQCELRAAADLFLKCIVLRRAQSNNWLFKNGRDLSLSVLKMFIKTETKHWLDMCQL